MAPKKCPRCQTFRDSSDFNGGYCRGCQREYGREWRARRPTYNRDYYAKWSRARKEIRRCGWCQGEFEVTRGSLAKTCSDVCRGRVKLAQQYGLDVEEFHDLFVRQAGCCAICHRELVKPVVDHCHKTGKVRGLLCNACNRGMGLLGDDPVRLSEARQYLNG